MRNKRAMEHPQEVVRMLFVAIILVFNIVIIYNLMSDMEAVNEYRIANLKYNTIASKILYSSDCYALETEYLLDGQKRHQVHAGILDADKLRKNNRLISCLGNAKATSKITIINSGSDEVETFVGTTVEKANLIQMLGEEKAQFFFKLPQLPEEIRKHLEDISESRATRKMLVMINDGGVVKQGLAELTIYV